MHLQLVKTVPPMPDAFEVPAVDLLRRPTRPGVTQAVLSLRVSSHLAAMVGELARTEGLREDAWIGLAIESERAVRLVTATAADAAQFRRRLDELSRERSVPIPGAPVRLTNFSAALRRLGDKRETRTAVTMITTGEEIALKASLPYQSVSAWRRCAIESGQSLDAWAADHLKELPMGRFLWEAAAVERGETLTEWVLTQAARRSAAR
jgi:hypothetical protein